MPGPTLFTTPIGRTKRYLVPPPFGGHGPKTVRVDFLPDPANVPSVWRKSRVLSTLPMLFYGRAPPLGRFFFQRPPSNPQQRPGWPRPRIRSVSARALSRPSDGPRCPAAAFEIGLFFSTPPTAWPKSYHPPAPFPPNGKLPGYCQAGPPNVPPPSQGFFPGQLNPGPPTPQQTEPSPGVAARPLAGRSSPANELPRPPAPAPRRATLPFPGTPQATQSGLAAPGGTANSTSN